MANTAKQVQRARAYLAHSGNKQKKTSKRPALYLTFPLNPKSSAELLHGVVRLWEM